MQVDFDISQPIYQQVIIEIQRSLVRGELKPGDKLPSQRDLAQTMKVNHNTIQRAYREMEGEGFVETIRGMGTFITNNPVIVEEIRLKMAGESIGRFIEEMCSLGMKGEQIIAAVREHVEMMEGSQTV
jgi:GntR family transcriptional regulator